MSNTVIKGSIIAIHTIRRSIKSIIVKVVRLYPVEYKIMCSLCNSNTIGDIMDFTI